MSRRGTDPGHVATIADALRKAALANVDIGDLLRVACTDATRALPRGMALTEVRPGSWEASAVEQLVDPTAVADGPGPRPIEVDCPVCWALPDQRCFNPRTNVERLRVHPERADVADGAVWGGVDTGWLVTTLPLRLLASRYDISVERLQAAARAGRVSGCRTPRGWVLGEASVVAWRQRSAERRHDAQETRMPRLPAEPLLALVAGRGGPAACGVRQRSATERALDRARRDGWVTARAADRLAVEVLGLTPLEVWGTAYAA